MIFFLYIFKFPTHYYNINNEYDLFLKKKLKFRMKEYDLIKTCDYSYFTSAINCILHHPYFKLFKSNYEYVENKEIKIGIFYSYYQYVKLLNNALWKMFMNSNNTIDILKYYDSLTKNEILIDNEYLRYYPHQIVEHLLHCINNNFSLEFYENDHFVQIINLNDTNIYHVTLNRYISNLLKHTNLNTLFITIQMDDQYQYNKTVNHFNDTRHSFLCDDNAIILKNTRVLKTQNSYMRGYIDDILRDNNIKSFNYIVNDYYLQSFVFTDKNFNCVYVKLKYDDKFNVIKRIRYFNNDKVSYEHIEDSLKEELNIFGERKISDYYYDDNFYNINLVCYVKK